MYNLPYFKGTDQSEILAFMKSYPFVFLSGCDVDNNPITTQVPVFIDEREGKLFINGHIMKQTDHHKAFLQNSNALVVFTGPHTYVSATWYDETQKEQASTWNYMSVHAKGKIRFGDESELIEILKRLSLHYENGNTESSTVFDNLSPEYVGQMMKAIVAFEIEVTDLQHVFKMSQNRNEASYDNIIKKLKEKGDDAKRVGEIMEERKSKVFKT